MSIKESIKEFMMNTIKENQRRYTFHLLVEGNDDFCMYEQKEDEFVIYADSDINAYNIMIQYCLEQQYQNFKVLSIDIC